MRIYNIDGVINFTDNTGVILTTTPAGSVFCDVQGDYLQFLSVGTRSVFFKPTVYMEVNDENGDPYGASSQQAATALDAILNLQNNPTINVIVDGQTPPATYAVTVTGLNCDTAATDVFILSGINGKVVKIVEVEFSGTKAGSLAVIDVLIIKRTDINTGGTYTSKTPVSYDPNNPAISPTCRAYTLNPTSLASAVGTIKTVRYGVATNNTMPQVEECIFNSSYTQRPTLRSAKECICLNFNGTTAATVENFNIYIEFTVE